MIKYITQYRNGCVTYNTETEEVDSLQPMRTHIDWHYLIEEDGEFKMEGKTAPVKKGDIVIKFYEQCSTPFIVLHSEEWLEIIENMKKKELEVKKCCGDCCDCESAN